MKLRFLLIAILFSAAALFGSQATSNSVPDDFPLSLWKEHKQVTQIPWRVSVSQAYFRSDLRQEIQILASIMPVDLEKSGDTHDLIFYVRAMEGTTPITMIHSVAPNAPPQIPSARSAPRGASWTQIALVRPGKYKLEAALLDRATGRYSTLYGDFSVPGDLNEPLEQALQSFPRFEFVEAVKAEDRVHEPIVLGATIFTGSSFPFPLRGLRGAALMSGTDFGVSTDPSPSFILSSPRKLHLSVMTILSPPERALENDYSVDLFQHNLTNFLSAFSRLVVVHGTATLTGVDLSDRSLVFDRLDLNEVTREKLHGAIDKDWNTVSVDTVAGKSESGRFFRDILKAKFEEAEKESEGAEHVIIVVSARSKFPKGANVPPLSPERDCHCRVIYVRFALEVDESDDMKGLLKRYNPEIFSPQNWQEFRKDFATIYGLLLR